MLELEKMPNIGKKLAENFDKAGIKTPEQLLDLKDPKIAFLKLREVYPEACQLCCYAITGAFEGVRWHDLSKEKKAEMKSFFQSLSK